MTELIRFPLEVWGKLNNDSLTCEVKSKVIKFICLSLKIRVRIKNIFTKCEVCQIWKCEFPRWRRAGVKCENRIRALAARWWVALDFFFLPPKNGVFGGLHFSLHCL